MALRDIEKVKHMVHEMSREGLRRRSELQYSLPCHWMEFDLVGAQIAQLTPLPFPPHDHQLFSH
jgi:hypothetical protein